MTRGGALSAFDIDNSVDYHMHSGLNHDAASSVGSFVSTPGSLSKSVQWFIDTPERGDTHEDL